MAVSTDQKVALWMGVFTTAGGGLAILAPEYKLIGAALVLVSWLVGCYLIFGVHAREWIEGRLGNQIEPATRPMPDMQISELFYYLCPSLLDNPNLLDQVEMEIIDKFSLGVVRVWGREISPYTVGRKPLREIESWYWEHAYLSHNYLNPDAPDWVEHVSALSKSELPAYANLQVSRSEVVSVWPQALAYRSSS